MNKKEYNADGVKRLQKIGTDQFDADLVNVVRCKNCALRYTACPLIKITPDGNKLFRTDNNGFCDYGKKGENNERT